MSQLADRRREAERRLTAVRTALRSELGLAPRRRGWVLGLLAGAVGLAIAVRRSGSRRKLRS